jgi:hypothetical protein
MVRSIPSMSLSVFGMYRIGSPALAPVARSSGAFLRIYLALSSVLTSSS